jgi:L-ribulose-5-phosphate 4-epimerase
MSDYLSLREECCEANRALAATGLVDLTFGNLSILDADAGVFAIKPSGVPYHALAAADMVVVALNGDVVHGVCRPSSDTPTHRRLLLHFEGVQSIVHTHSRNAVAFAQAARAIPLLGTTHADYFHGDVPITRPMTDPEIQGDYEWETGGVIIETFANKIPLNIPAVLVCNHGPFVWADSATKAIETAQALEIVAEMALQALALNPSATGPSAALRDKHFFRKHGKSAYYGQCK